MRKALVVGIDNYSSAPLRGCVNDANSIAAVLSTHGDGSQNFDVRLVTAPGAFVGRAELRGAIEKLFEGSCDVALFYFSGHGLIKSSGGYLVTQDVKKYDEGISMDEILNLANRSAANEKIILLDCCHSGALGSPVLGGGAAVLSEGMSVLTASRDTESAMEIDGRGVFTSLVVDALRGGAADLRGHVSGGGVYAYVDQALGPWDQRPIFKTNVSRFTAIRSISPPVPFETLRKICLYFPRPQDEFLLNPSFEFTDPSADPANVAVFKDLQKFEGVALVVPVGEEHMYFAAMNSKSCRLTALGYQYWRLVKERRI